MPLTKLKFVKLMLDLADEPKFIIELNDSQKLDFFLMLLMAGLTHNEIPINYGWIKSRFNLVKSEDEIKTNIEHIKKTFRGFIQHNGRYKFKNFKQLHNYIYKENENSLGILREYLKSSPNIYYIISNIISYYMLIKHIREEDIDIMDKNRYGRRIKELLVKAKGNSELVKKAIKWISEQKYIDWTLETVIKKWPDFMASQNKPVMRQETCGNCFYLKPEPYKQGMPGHLCTETDKIQTLSTGACRKFKAR